MTVELNSKGNVFNETFDRQIQPKTIDSKWKKVYTASFKFWLFKNRYLEIHVTKLEKLASQICSRWSNSEGKYVYTICSIYILTNDGYFRLNVFLIIGNANDAVVRTTVTIVIMKEQRTIVTLSIIMKGSISHNGNSKHQKQSPKKTFWKILQKSQENNCVEVSFLIMLQA